MHFFSAFSFPHCFFYKVSQAIRKTLYDRIVNSVFMRYNTLTTKAVPWAIGFGTRAISVYILTNGAFNGFLIHS
jgi:hypothetical protein